MNHTRHHGGLPLLLCGTLVLWATAAQADIHKCTLNGRTTFQQTPCNEGHGSPGLDEIAARERALAARREGLADKERATIVGGLKDCVTRKDCEAARFRSLLAELKTAAHVEQALGKPESVQSYQSKELHYYVVPTADGRKKAMLQIRYAPDQHIEAANAY
ncbi:MAG: hypothetical protein JNJ60_04880 [Rhodocyclaceae bacterium]|nr:hypothetical protein [Rhodocyclaceae bacterium]